jgi:hypothetical protein
LPESQKELELEGPFTKDFDQVLGYMYEGTVEFSAENAVQLLAMSDFYMIKELKRSAIEFIVGSITKENAIPMIQKAIEFNSEEVINKCLQVQDQEVLSLLKHRYLLKVSVC